jgi:KDO2-lipid IV(A) lauroyltransferase
MRRRSLVRDLAEYGLALAVVKSLQYAPRPLAWRMGFACARLLDRALPRLRRVAYRNLAMALPEADAKSVVDGVYRSIGRLLVVFAKLPSIRKQNLSRWIRLEGGEHFQAAQQAGRGVLFAASHLGNWELSAFAHALLAEPMYVVVRPLDNPFIDRLVERRRSLSGNRPLFKKDFARTILKALGNNQAVGILIDQNTTADQGAFVDFFGMPACSGTGFAKLAAHSGAAVIPGYAVWHEDERRYVLRFEPPVEITGDVSRDTQTLHTILERIIRRYPDQWLWIHRRWKTQPPGTPALYD